MPDANTLLKETFPLYGGMLQQRFGGVLQRLAQLKSLGFWNNLPGTVKPGQEYNPSQAFSDQYGADTTQQIGENVIRPDQFIAAADENTRFRTTAQDTVRSEQGPAVDRFKELANTPAVTQEEVNRIVQGFRENAIHANQAAMANATATGSARGLSPDAIASINSNLGAETMFQSEQNRAATEVAQEEINRAQALAATQAWNTAASDYANNLNQYEYDPNPQNIWDTLAGTDLARNDALFAALTGLGNIETAQGGASAAFGQQNKDNRHIANQQAESGGWLAPAGGAVGMGLGALLAAPTGGLSIPMGMMLGAAGGGLVGGIAEAATGGGTAGISQSTSTLPYYLATMQQPTNPGPVLPSSSPSSYGNIPGNSGYGQPYGATGPRWNFNPVAGGN